jgi:hypothetical protein
VWGLTQITWEVGGAAGRPQAVVGLSKYHHRSVNGVAGTIYLWAKTNLGTCNVQARLMLVP